MHFLRSHKPQPEETFTKEEALGLGIIGNESLGFVHPTQAFKRVNKQIMEHLKAGDLFWRKPWRDGYRVKGVTYGPQNYVSGNPYRGMNAWYINFVNFNIKESNNYFLTAKQIHERGGKLKKDAVGYPVHAFIKGVKVEKTKSGKEIEYPVAGWVNYIVYPIGHTEGVKPIKRKDRKATPEEIVVDAETILEGMPKRPEIKHGGNEAFYAPAQDFVQMPYKKAFPQQKKYYSVLFHELIHSTAHKKRIGRDLSGRFGSKSYAFEELIAELGAAYLCAVCDIEYHTLKNSAAYLKGWAKKVMSEVREDNSFMFRAILGASKAAKYIIGNTLEKAGIKRAANTQMKMDLKGLGMTDREFTEMYGENAYKLLKRQRELLGQEYTQLNRIHKHAQSIIDLGEKNKTIAAAEALQYEVLLGDNFNDYRKAIARGGMELNYEGLKRVSDIGIKIPDDIRKQMREYEIEKGLNETPDELNGIHDPALIMIFRYLRLHNQTTGKVKIKSLIDTLQGHIKRGEIKKDHPYAKEILHIQDQLVRAYNSLTQHKSVTIEIKNREKYENIITKELGGLGLIPSLIAAVAGKTVEHLAHKALKKPALNGVKSPKKEKKKSAPKVKKHTTDNGHRCSGFGVYPSGKKCNGCSDCNGKQPSKSEVKKMIDKRSFTITKKKPAQKKQVGALYPETKKKFGPVNGLGFVRADQKEIVKVPGTFRLGGEIGKFLQDIQPYKYSIVITGDPHAGKTEFVSQLQNAFAEAGKEVGVFDLEQGGLTSKDTRAALDRNVTPENLKRISIAGDAAKGIQTIKEQAKNFDVIMVDSWQKLGVPSSHFDSLRHEHPDKIWVIIFQQTTDGKTKGGTAADYDSPVLLKVHRVDETFKNNYVELKKNRGNSLNVKYMIKDKKTVPLTENSK
jgi:antirestriction protein ArdC